MKSACRSAVRELLPWYLNGSLEGSEAGEVQAHLASCPDCVRDLHDLGEIAELVRLHGAPSNAAAPEARPAAIPFPAQPKPQPGRRRRNALAAGIAAMLAGVLLAALLRSERPDPRSASGDAAPAPGPAAPAGPPPAAPAMLARLDLGPGPVRGAEETPVLRLPEGAERIEVSFVIPGVGRAATVRMEDEEGRPIADAVPVGGHDEMGRSTAVFSAAPFRHAGSYTLVLSQVEQAEGETGAGTRIEYRYPFRFQPEANGSARP